MGDKVAGEGAAGGARWWLASRLATLLDRDERLAVMGDILESRADGGRALRDVLGLVVRRQAALWLQPASWVATAFVAVPLGFLLSYVSRWWADGSAIYLHLYKDRLTWAYMQHDAARGDFIEFALVLLVDCAALIGWSWTCGFVLGALSPRTRWLTGSLFTVLVFASTVGSTSVTRPFGNAFFETGYPLLLRTLFVVVPLVAGMRASVKRRYLPVIPALLVLAAVIAVTVFEARGVEGALSFGGSVMAPQSGPDGIFGSADDPRPLRLLPILMAWPALYIAAVAARQRRNERRAHA